MPSLTLQCHFERDSSIVDIIKIDPRNNQATLVTTMPARVGTVSTTDNEYEIFFPAVKDPAFWRLRLRVNRYTGKGEREFGDKPWGSKDNLFNLIECNSYDRKKL